MDPLSTASSIIALGTALKAINTGVQKLLALKEAPKRLVEVHNQVEELKTLLEVTRHAAESSPVTEPHVVLQFNRLVDRATEAAHEADYLIREKLVKNPASLDDEGAKPVIRKTSFLRKENKLKTLSDQLKQVQASLQAALECINSLHIQRMTLTLDSVHLYLRQGQEPEQQPELGESPRVQEITDEATLDSVADIVTSIGPSYPDSTDSVRIDSTPITTNSLMLSSQEVLASSPPSPSTYCTVEATVTIEESPLEICGCPCHSPVMLKSPNWLGTAVGTLLVKWHRDQRPCERCLRRSCKASRDPLLRTRYYFPWWLCRRFVEFESFWTASQKLITSLYFKRTIPNDSQVFLLAQHNNIEGMKRLLELRLASPFDVSVSGRTPLHFAASAVKAEMIEFLVKQGAETDVEDQNRFTAHDIIWELYLRNPVKRLHFLTAGGLSPDDTASLEKQLFSPIHQIVLGIGPSLNLDDYLKMDRREIDAQDYSGKTPLSWATQRKNTQMVQILLEHGASVAIPDHRGKTPLHLASGSGTPEAVELILKVIKDIEKDLDDPKKSLIHAQDEKNRTPLNYATRGNLYPHAQLLIQYGADVEAPEADTNRSIILNAIYRNGHEVIPLLLEHGARTDVCDVHGATILHHISRFGSLEMIRAFSRYRLGPVDPNAVDSQGLTAMEAFNSQDARCNPDNVADRAEAAELLKSILLNIRPLSDVLEPIAEIESPNMV